MPARPLRSTAEVPLSVRSSAAEGLRKAARETGGLVVEGHERGSVRLFPMYTLSWPPRR